MANKLIYNVKLHLAGKKVQLKLYQFIIHVYQWIKNDGNNNRNLPLDVICGGLQNYLLLKCRC